MQVGVFLPIANNGWLVSTTSPQYKPSFDLNRSVVEMAERFEFDFALSIIELHGFGGLSQFWDYNLESFTLMAGLAAVTSRIQLFATCAVLTMPPPLAARMAGSALISYPDGSAANTSKWESGQAARIINAATNIAPSRCRSRKSFGQPGNRISRAISSKWTTAAACRCPPRRSPLSARVKARPARGSP